MAEQPNNPAQPATDLPRPAPPRIAAASLARPAQGANWPDYGQVAGALGDAVWDWDISSNRFAWSEGALAPFGYAPQSVAGDPTWFCQRIHPEDRDRVLAGLTSAVLGSATRWADEYRFQRADGSYAQVLDRGYVELRDALPARRLTGILTDLSPHLEPVAVLRASEQRLRQVLQYMPVMLMAFRDSGEIAFWNHECEEVLGFTAEEVVDRPGGIALLVPNQAYREQMIAEWERRGDAYRDWEWELTCKDGTRRRVTWSNVSARVPIAGWRFWTVGRDVTERAQASDSLLHSEARFQAFMDHNPAVAFMKDATGRYVYVNRMWREMFRRPSEDIVGRTDFDYLPHEVALVVRENDAAVLGSGQVREIMEVVPTPDGIRREWIVWKFPFFDQAGRQFVGGVAVDITARVRAEQALREARDRLELDVDQRTADLVQTNRRLEEEVARRERVEIDLRGERLALERLVAYHERESRLTSYEIHDGLVQYVTGALMHLETKANQPASQLAGDSDYQRALGLLRRSLSEARRLISGLRPPVLDELGLVPAIDYLIRDERFGEGLDCHLTVNEEFDDLSPEISTALFRICQEALTNAQRYSQAHRVDVRLTRTAGTVRLVVEDDGAGFNLDSVSPRSFGLVGMRERARLLGGRASITSAPQQGTRIDVELPLASRHLAL